MRWPEKSNNRSSLKSFLSGSGVKDLSYLMEKYKFKTTDFNIIHL